MRAMTPRDALMEACFRARAYRYLPDEITTPDGVVVPIDVWDTRSEFEARRGGDCDGFTCWAMEHAALAAPDAALWFVAGEVLIRGQWIGHAWIELQSEDATLWADPTWGHGPQAPTSLGYPTTRRAVKRWRRVGYGPLFGQEEAYVVSA